MAGPKKKLTKVEASGLIPVVTVINEKRTKFHIIPTQLPIPSQVSLHQSGPLRGNVKIMDNRLKTRIVTRAGPSSKCVKM
ncbi:MAG: hypothetical protein OEX77_04240 [Candidatus Bathyarchaeota archaeon]|nr:hypothetical protein [Candidatus Bathyarchaeota archaeon]